MVTFERNFCISFPHFLLGPSSMFPSMDNFLDESNHDQIVPSLSSPGQISPRSPTDYLPERYSRKVFVGGLPPDIDEGENIHKKISDFEMSVY